MMWMLLIVTNLLTCYLTIKYFSWAFKVFLQEVMKKEEFDDLIKKIENIDMTKLSKKLISK